MLAPDNLRASSQSLTSFSIYPSIRDGELLAALKFYGDDSGDAADPRDGIVAVGGFLATAGQWVEFEARWNAMLNKHGFDYIHMREFDPSKGPFERLKGKVPERIALLSDMAAAIVDSRLRGIAMALPISELKRFRQKYPGEAFSDAYSLCLYSVCMAAMQKADIRVPWQIVMDRRPGVHGKIAEAVSLLESDGPMPSNIADGFKIPSFAALSDDGPGAKDIPAMQAADFLAWETHRSAYLKLDWLLNVKPTLPVQTNRAFDVSVVLHQARAKKVRFINKDNFLEVRERKCFAALIKSGLVDYALVDLPYLEVLREHRLKKIEVGLRLSLRLVP